MASRGEFVPTIKIILVGESSVGKTALLSRFLQGDEFDVNDLSATVGPTFKLKDFTVRDRKVKLELRVRQGWNASGRSPGLTIAAHSELFSFTTHPTRGPCLRWRTGTENSKPSRVNPQPLS